MAGIFDIKKGAFDSSEAALLHEAYEIALNGLRTKLKGDRKLIQSLARFVVKVARSEPDCLRNDGSIDPAKLAQRAILRMLQTKAPDLALEEASAAGASAVPPGDASLAASTKSGPESPAKVMMRLFERTPFAKL